MDIDAGTILPRGELIKTIVAAEPTAAADARQSEDIIESDDDDGPRLEYITQLEMSCDNKQLAAALSSLEINLYSVETMALAGKVKGHTGPLTQLAFAPSDPSCFFSASEDGTVRGWDTRSLATTITLGDSEEEEEVYSMALGYDGRLCATGKDCLIEFYDLRKAGKPLGSYSECHTDAVTQVRFHPHKRSFMLTGSEDGLMCFFDTEVSLEEDALDSVMNAECPVRSVGFFGPEGEGVYCCTNTESLSLWHAAGAQRIKDFGDVRALARGENPAEADVGAGDGATAAAVPREGGGLVAAARAAAAAAAAGEDWGVAVDCIVNCQYDAAADRLRLVTSSYAGAACLATVSPEGITPDAILEGGHAEQIRTFQWMGRAMATGGEDARICSWRLPGGGEDGSNDKHDDDDAMDDDR
ncbi:unnamed protein product [Ectocarpus sp. CCAP 1310/34]|nr:unnamed protein product [Ectocarpus sp. CCAP 1310/34]